MIIVCINCNKKFNVDQYLIPENGRQIQCGSCNYNWHYKVEKLLVDTNPLEEDNIDKQANNVKDNVLDAVPLFKNKIEKKVEIKKNIKKTENEIINEFSQKKKIISANNFFSYLIVFIISLGILIIIVDTLRSPLINLFPSLEIILFNLFETFKDIKSFIIDLT